MIFKTNEFYLSPLTLHLTCSLPLRLTRCAETPFIAVERIDLYLKHGSELSKEKIKHPVCRCAPPNTLVCTIDHTGVHHRAYWCATMFYNSRNLKLIFRNFLGSCHWYFPSLNVEFLDHFRKNTELLIDPSVVTRTTPIEAFIISHTAILNGSQ